MCPLKKENIEAPRPKEAMKKMVKEPVRFRIEIHRKSGIPGTSNIVDCVISDRRPSMSISCQTKEVWITDIDKKEYIYNWKRVEKIVTVPIEWKEEEISA